MSDVVQEAKARLKVLNRKSRLTPTETAEKSVAEAIVAGRGRITANRDHRGR